MLKAGTTLSRMLCGHAPAAGAALSSTVLRRAPLFPSAAEDKNYQGCPGTLRFRYWSGSFYELTHMEGKKNPELPEDDACAEVAIKVFGIARYSNPHQRSLRKVLKAPLKGDLIADYWGDTKKLVHNQFDYQDPHRLRQEAKLVRLRKRGKGPPPKGQGKRASRGK
eukprot:3058312-Rhodomonas_salina.2